MLDRGNDTGSFVDCGLDAEIIIDRKLEPGLRVTVKLPDECMEMSKPYGVVVSPDEPRVQDGFYWGYIVRAAGSLSEVC